MSISLRPPERRPNRCPVCAEEVTIEPSQPLRGARCPNCGNSLCFGSGGAIRDPAKVTARRRLLKAGVVLALAVLALSLFFFGAARLSSLELAIIVVLAAVLFGARWFNAVVGLRRFWPFRRR